MKNNDWANAFLNPLAIAGANILNPTIGQQLTGAAVQQREQQLTQAQVGELERKKQEALRAQMVAQSLPQAIQELRPGNLHEAISKLISLGLEPDKALSLAKGIQPDEKDVILPDALGGYNAIPTRNGKVVGGALSPNNTGVGGISPQAGGLPAEQAQNVGAGGLNDRIQNSSVSNTPYGQKAQYEADLAERARLNQEKSKFLSDLVPETRALRAVDSTLDRLESLLPQFYQGVGAEYANLPGKITGKESAAAFADFESSTKQLVLELSKNLKGAQSNYDIQNIEKTKPSIDNTREGNQRIIEKLRAMGRRELDYNTAAREYLKDPNHTLLDFQRKWDEYANAFHVFDAEGNVSEENLDAWKDILFLPDQEFDAQIAANTEIRKTDRNKEKAAEAQKKDEAYINDLKKAAGWE